MNATDLALLLHLMRPLPEEAAQLPSNIASKIDFGAECWNWAASTNRGGYGQVRFDGTIRRAHRVVYELLRGSIGDAHLDHLCRNRRCVNPDHLEPVTQQENNDRARAAKWSGASRDTCLNGHDLTDPANVYRQPKNPKNRRCRACQRDRQAAYEGNGTHGPRTGLPKLTEASVIEIRRRHSLGEGTRSLADEFGIAYRTAYDLVQGRTWKHIRSDQPTRQYTPEQVVTEIERVVRHD